MTKIKYTGPQSVNKIMDMAGTRGINNSRDGLYVCRDGVMLKFRRGENVVVWDNGKITREKEDIV